MILDLSAAVLAEVAKYAKPATGQKSLTWTEEDEQKHPRDEAGRFAHTMSRGEFHQQEKVKPGYDLQQTNKTYWAAVKAAAMEGKEVHPKADEEHRQIFGEVVPRGSEKSETPPQRTTFVGGDEARFTGKTQTIGGGTFHEVEMLEGARKGQTALVRDEAEKAAESAKKKAEWQEQQDGFSRLHESAGQPGSQSGKRPISKQPDESPTVTKMRESIKKALVADFGEKIGGARKDKSRPLGSRGKKADDASDARPAWARRYNVSQIEKSSNKSEEGQWEITDEKDTDWMGNPKQKGGLFSSKEEAEASLPLIAVSRNHRVYQERTNKDQPKRYAIVRNITDRKRAIVKGGFETEDEAERYMESHASEIIEHQFPRYEDYAYLDHVERKGPEHKTPGANVTPEDFQKAFQFRGGEFGNWQSGKDGITSLNHAYDALHDLSDALGLPAKAVALNGDLAIAFGARGTGGKNSARAHYEPDARVMNLTKMKGAGSLAHEWSHALDWHLGNGEHAISDPSYKTKLRTEVAEAAKNLRDVISTKETTRVREADRETKMADKAKEALESHFKDLENNLKGSSYRPAKPFTPDQQKQWDAAKAKILSGDVGESKYILKDPDASAQSRGGMTGKHSFPILEEMNALYKKSLGRSFHTSDTNSTGNRIYWAIKRFDDGNKRVASVGEGAADKIRGKSDFHNEAVKLDSTQIGNYYSLPHEMFARAFEAYAADKLNEKGIRSDYLVSRGKTDNASYAMWGLKPFPEGDERKSINAAFDQFFAALKHQPRSDERGEHVQLYARERIADSLRRGIECYSLRSDIDRAAASTDVMPSREQAEAGNYRKGRFRLWGKEIVIENPRGSIRSGCSRDGKFWSVEMPDHYGYIRQYVSEADGDHVDVYIGRHPESEVVFIVDQQHPDDGRFDEHKCFIGFRSAMEAKRTYLAAFAHGGKARERFGDIATMTKSLFLDWLDNGDTSRPVCGTKSVVTYSRVTDAVNQFVRLGRVERYAFDPEKHPRGEDGRWIIHRQSFEMTHVSVVLITGTKLSTKKELRDSGLKSRGSYRNEDTKRMIHVYAKGVRHSAQMHGIDHRILAEIPSLIEHAIHFSTESPKAEKNVQSVHNFYVPVQLDGQTLLARLIVKEYVDKQYGVQEARLYNIGHQKTKRLASKADASTEVGAPAANEPPRLSIGQLISAVKEKHPEHVNPDVRRSENYAAQRGLFDEDKHPRDEAGKFTLKDRIHEHLSKAAGPVKHRELLKAMGHTDVDPQNPQANLVNKALKEMRDAGEIESHQPQWGEPSFSAKQKPSKPDAAYDAHVARRKERGQSPLSPKQFESQRIFQQGVEADRDGEWNELDHEQWLESPEWRKTVNGSPRLRAMEAAADKLDEEWMNSPGIEDSDEFPPYTEQHKQLDRDVISAIEANGGTVEESIKQHVGYGSPSPARQNRNAENFGDNFPPAPSLSPKPPAKTYPHAPERENRKANRDPIAAQPKPPSKQESVAGQQQGLFDRGEFTTGQKSLFNVIAPDKPKSSKANNTADLFAGMAADVVAHLKDKATISPADRGIVVQAESLPGQREMFQRRGAVMRYHATAIPSRPDWLKPKPATQQESPEQQQQPSKSKPSKGGWQKVGGSSVFVNSAGRIIKGCPGLKGHHVHELIDESDESRDHRAAKQAHAESRGLTGNDLTATAANKLGSKAMISQHQSAKSAAKRMGVPTKEVLGSMSDAATVNSHHVGRMEELKSRARQLTGMNAGTLARIENAYRDHSTVPRFDETVASLQEEFPDVGFGNDPADFVWQAMRQGKATKLSHDDIASEAANMVSASRQQRTSAMIGRMTKDVTKKMAETVADDSFSFGANVAF